MIEHLQFVEEDNTWKALLQLLYDGDFTDLSQFVHNINSLSEVDFKVCVFTVFRRNVSRKKTFSSKAEKYL